MKTGGGAGLDLGEDDRTEDPGWEELPEPTGCCWPGAAKGKDVF